MPGTSFHKHLCSAIANGTYVLNQSQLLMSGTVVALSDDPNVNGAADPTVAGRRGPDAHPDRVGAGVPGPEDVDGSDRRP